MALLIDTGVVPARQRAEFWSEASCDVYHPGFEIRTDAGERFAARMWRDEVASVGGVPDREPAEHDAANAATRSRPAIPSACT